MAQEIIALKLEKQIFVAEEGTSYDLIMREEKKKGINNLEFNNIMSQDFLNLIDRIIFQKWYTKITIKIDREYEFTTIALVDSGADTNCIQEGIISN